MRVNCLILAALTGIGFFASPFAMAQGAGESDAAVPEVIDDIKLTAQQAALSQLTGEHPFILRETGWGGELTPGEAKLIQMQLFKRNEYQFWFAVANRKAGLNLNVYNASGEIMEADSIVYDTSNVVSLIVRPEETGVYYVRLSLQTTIDDPQRWSVIYAYR
jgi:hypothetical protein